MIRGFFVLFFVSKALFLNAQIFIKNNSFEDQLHIDCYVNKVPFLWNQCGYNVSNCNLFDTELFLFIHPDTAFDGLGVCGLRYDYNSLSLPNAIGKIFQKLDCSLNDRYTYSFSFWNAGLVNDYYPNKFFMGKTVISLGTDSCEETEVIYETNTLDTIWREEKFVFKPTLDADYFFISVKPKVLAWAEAMVILIDALSPIYVVNAHELEATTPDTLYMDKKQQCINLSATASATMDSVWWEQVGVGIISHQLDAGVVCVDSNTTFIVHGIGTDSTCAGYLPSSDTVRIRFYDPTDVSSPSLNSVKVYPNPAKEYITIEAEESGTFELYNNLGQLLQIREISKTKPEAMRLHELSYGVYYYKFISRNKYELYGKLVKQ